MNPGRGPQRTCLGCRTVFDQKQLLRFVLSPQKEVVVDYRGRLPGRGAYTCLNVQCLRMAVKTKGFQRAFHQQDLNLAADDLVKELEGAVREKIFNLLGMIRKAGMGIVGSNLVLARMQLNAPLLGLIVAQDMAPGMESKVCDKARGRDIPVYRIGTRAELGKIWGRDLVSVVGLLPDLLASRFEEEINRFRTIAEGY